MLSFIESLEPKWLKKYHFPNWIVLTLALVFIFRIPTFFEPYYNLSEIEIISLISFLNLFWLKAMFTAWMMLVIVFFWKLSDKLSPKNKQVALGSTVSFAVLTTIPLWQGNIVSLQAVVVGIIIIALYFFLPVKLLKIKKFTKPFVFAFLWLAVSIFTLNTTFMIPAISMLIGVLLASTKIDQSLTLIPLLIFILVAMKFNFEFKPTLSYYQNFVSFATSQTSQEEYLKFFSEEAGTSYKVAKFLVSSSKNDDVVFVWSDSPSTYILSKRSPYLGEDTTDELLAKMSKRDIFGKVITDKPKFIVVANRDDPFVELQPFLTTNYILIERIDNARIWKYSQALSTLVE